MKADDRRTADELRGRGFGVIPPDQYLIDMEPEFKKIWKKSEAFTMTSVERGYALYNAVRYIILNDVQGDFAECGVWKGGSCMIAAMTLLELGVKDRKIYLYDTFSGMPEPSEHDFIASNGRSVREKWLADDRGRGPGFGHWAVGVEAVRQNLEKTGYPEDNFIFVEGPVEEMLNKIVPESLSILRLDTDWYESTKAELEILYPVLCSRGVLIIDDYGHFTGARTAVDDYFIGRDPILLNRIDYTGRIGIKC